MGGYRDVCLGICYIFCEAYCICFAMLIAMINVRCLVDRFIAIYLSAPFGLVGILVIVNGMRDIKKARIEGG